MTIHLVRHGKAGSRNDWKGPDDERPLSKRGRRQAEWLVDRLADGGIVSIYASPSLRCVQTVEPLADQLGLTVENRLQLAEGAAKADVAGLLEDVVGTTVAMCSHGDVIPVILEVLVAEHGLQLPDDYACAKGSVWELAEDRAGRMTARYLSPPK